MGFRCGYNPQNEDRLEKMEACQWFFAINSAHETEGKLRGPDEENPVRAVLRLRVEGRRSRNELKLIREQVVKTNIKMTRIDVLPAAGGGGQVSPSLISCSNVWPFLSTINAQGSKWGEVH